MVARENLTCLVLSRTPKTPYAGRGAGATTAEPSASFLPPGTFAIDVTGHLNRKLGALGRHRTQYPIVPSMLPRSLLKKMLGTEFFCLAVSGRRSGRRNNAVSRPVKAPFLHAQRGLGSAVPPEAVAAT